MAYGDSVLASIILISGLFSGGGHTHSWPFSKEKEVSCVV